MQWKLFSAPLLFILLSCNGENFNLKLSQIVWRHGDRAPLIEYPTNPHASYWKQGIGQLTQLGMRQHYELGKYFQTRYNGFISSHYFHQQIYLMAANIDRLIESAQSDMAGWFPPTDWQIFEKNLSWQPIPIHITEASEIMLNVHWNHCPTWVDQNKIVTSQPDYVATVKEATPMMEYLQKYMEIPVGFQSNLNYVADLFLCDKIHNLTEPEWFKEGVNYDQLQYYSKYYLMRCFETPVQQVVTGGTVLYDIRESLINFTSKEDTMANNVIVYSGHDVTIIPVSKLLGVFNNQMVPYAAALILELYDDQNADNYVKISYKNETDHDPYVLKMPSCGNQEYCPLETFLTLTEDKVLKYDKWDEYCQIKT